MRITLIILVSVAVGFTAGTASAKRRKTPLSATGAPTPMLTATSTAAPTGTATATPAATATATAVPLLTTLKAAQEITTGFFAGITWTLVALLLPLFFWKYVARLLRGMAAAMETRAFTVDVGTFKVIIGERPLDASIDQTRLFSHSPFELDPVPDRPSALIAIEPQNAYVFSDFVAGIWAASHQNEVGDMGAALDRLKLTCDRLRDPAGNPRATLADVRAEVVEYVRRLEAVRFLRVSEFSSLLDSQEPLRTELENMTLTDLPGDQENCLIIFAAGLSYAHCGQWTLATQLLSKVALKNLQPHYYPAGDSWIGSTYHQHVQELLMKEPQLPFDSRDFSDPVNAMLESGRAIDEAIRTKDGAMQPASAAYWTRQFGVSVNNVAYYKRELWKSLGFLYSFLGDYSKAPEKRKQYFTQAMLYLSRCNEEVDGDPPTPLDRNNLADVYRQLGELPEATRLVNQALKEVTVPDPSFYNTQAWIFWNDGQPLSGFLALQHYGETEADKADQQDLEQYVLNQIFAAKLAANIPEASRPSYVALAASRLETARLFVNRKEDRLGKSSANKLLAEIEELLGICTSKFPAPRSSPPGHSTALKQSGGRRFPRLNGAASSAAQKRIRGWRVWNAVAPPRKLLSHTGEPRTLF
jgi:tetratricopeptide (TPR) repeat protein